MHATCNREDEKKANSTRMGLNFILCLQHAICSSISIHIAYACVFNANIINIVSQINEWQSQAQNK